MCDFIKRLFGGEDENAAQLLGLFRQQQAETKRANELAAQAAKDAKARAAAAMTPPADREDVRAAAERRMRRLLGSRTPDEITSLGAAPVAYKVLMGQ